MNDKSRSELFEIAAILLTPHGPSDCIEDYSPILRKKAVGRLVEEIRQHSELKRTLAIRIREVLERESGFCSIPKHERDCSNCKFEPEWKREKSPWDKGKLCVPTGICNWDGQVPVCMPGKKLTIFQQTPHKNCPAWRPK